MREDMKAVIADTFSQMLDKEDIDKITVTKLIAECHISRQTFYYHFKDIMDVLEWTFRRATQELVQKSLNEEDRLCDRTGKNSSGCSIPAAGFRSRGCLSRR